MAQTRQNPNRNINDFAGVIKTSLHQLQTPKFPHPQISPTWIGILMFLIVVRARLRYHQTNLQHVLLALNHNFLCFHSVASFVVYERCSNLPLIFFGAAKSKKHG